MPSVTGDTTRRMRFSPLLQTLLTIAAGIALAIAIYPLWNLSGRWFVVTVVGLSLVCLALVFIRRFADFLMVSMFFAIPVASFTKWLGLGGFVKEVADAAPFSGTLAIGIFDFILAGMYLVWFVRIFVSRTAPMPRLNVVDAVVMAWFAAYVLSIPGTHSVLLGLFSAEYVFVHVLFYLYVSRNFHWRHVPWFVLAIFFTAALEAAIGLGQAQGSISPGLALDKGAGGEDLDYQYAVPGMEDTTRATGTVYDSHTLGLYASMLLVALTVFVYSPGLRRSWRVAGVVAGLAAAATLLMTYSRSAWLVAIFAVGLVIMIQVLLWRERGVLWSLLGLAVLSVPAWPWALEIIYDRFYNAPEEVLSVRFEQWEVALHIWRNHFLTGFGVGNYMYSLDFYNFGMAEELLVHNMFLGIAAESGLLGLLTYLTMVTVIGWRLWIEVLRGSDPLRRVALVALVCLAAYLADGMSNPLFRDPVIFKYYWVMAAIAAALPRLRVESGAAAATTAAPAER